MVSVKEERNANASFEATRKRKRERVRSATWKALTEAVSQASHSHVAYRSSAKSDRISLRDRHAGDEMTRASVCSSAHPYVTFIRSAVGRKRIVYIQRDRRILSSVAFLGHDGGKSALTHRRI